MVRETGFFYNGPAISLKLGKAKIHTSFAPPKIDLVSYHHSEKWCIIFVSLSKYTRTSMWSTQRNYLMEKDYEYYQYGYLCDQHRGTTSWGKTTNIINMDIYVINTEELPHGERLRILSIWISMWSTQRNYLMGKDYEYYQYGHLCDQHRGTTSWRKTTNIINMDIYVINTEELPHGERLRILSIWISMWLTQRNYLMGKDYEYYQYGHLCDQHRGTTSWRKTTNIINMDIYVINTEELPHGERLRILSIWTSMWSTQRNYLMEKDYEYYQYGYLCDQHRGTTSWRKTTNIINMDIYAINTEELPHGERLRILSTWRNSWSRLSNTKELKLYQLKIINIIINWWHSQDSSIQTMNSFD